jgi:hypothetical protein
MSNQTQLTGATSALLHELFQVALDNAAAITGQSARFPDAIEAATGLAKAFAPAIVALEIPLSDVRGEVCSILRGLGNGDAALQVIAINNSGLAKHLGVTIEMIEQWASGGRLVHELIDRLQMHNGES